MKIACVVGTRPEAIKMAPVIREIELRDGLDPVIIFTGQHRHLARQALDWFSIRPHHNLDVMSPDQSLSELSARLFSGFDQLWDDITPPMILVQGDTTSAMVAAFSAFYRQIPVAHVEAGLRTHDRQSPFPEEMNRVMISRIAGLHFAPTERARNNLLGENVADSDILVTGNTVIDALYQSAGHAQNSVFPHDPSKFLVLVSIHRRENLGAPLRAICSALRILHDLHGGVEFVLPVHPNPNVASTIHEMLGTLPRFHLTSPLDYPALADLVRRSRFLMTDSGGLQEEGPAFGKPVLILRDQTERSEILDAGIGMLVGSDPDRIVAEAMRLLRDDDHLCAMASGGSPFGDGKAAPRIVDRCVEYLDSVAAQSMLPSSTHGGVALPPPPLHGKLPAYSRHLKRNNQLTLN